MFFLFFIFVEALLQSTEATAAPKHQQSPCRPVLVAAASPLSVDRGRQQPREGWNDHWSHPDLARLPEALWVKSDHLEPTRKICGAELAGFTATVNAKFGDWDCGWKEFSKHWYSSRLCMIILFALCGKSSQRNSPNCAAWIKAGDFSCRSGRMTSCNSIRSVSGSGDSPRTCHCVQTCSNQNYRIHMNSEGSKIHPDCNDL